MRKARHCSVSAPKAKSPVREIAQPNLIVSGASGAGGAPSSGGAGAQAENDKTSSRVTSAKKIAVLRYFIAFTPFKMSVVASLLD